MSSGTMLIKHIFYLNGQKESSEKIINLLWLNMKAKQIYTLIISTQSVSRAPN